LRRIQRGSGGADVMAALSSETIKELRKTEAEKSVLLAQLTSRFKGGYRSTSAWGASLGIVRLEARCELRQQDAFSASSCEVL